LEISNNNYVISHIIAHTWFMIGMNHHHVEIFNHMSLPVTIF